MTQDETIQTVNFEIKEKGISGTIKIEGEEIFVEWYEWESEDCNRVLIAMGKALGYPVVFANPDEYKGDNGHYSSILRKATEEEAAIQTKIGQCPAVNYWSIPLCYKQVEEMRFELGDALLYERTQSITGAREDNIGTWVIDISKVDRKDFFDKWVSVAFQDGIEAAKAGNWQDAYYASSLAFFYSAGDKAPEISAFYFIADTQFKNENTDLIIVLCRSFDFSSVQKLQEYLNKFCEYFGLSPSMFDIKKIIKEYLDKNPGRKKIDIKLVNIMKKDD